MSTHDLKLLSTKSNLGRGRSDKFGKAGREEIWESEGILGFGKGFSDLGLGEDELSTDLSRIYIYI